MSTGLAAVRVRPRAQSVPLQADAIAIGAVALLVAALGAYVWGTWGDMGRDTGYDFVAATRVAHGQFPYIDYVYYYGPLAPFLGGLFAVVGGGGVGSFVALGLTLTLAIVAATYALARSVTGPSGAAFAAAVTAAVAFSPTNVSFVLPHTFSETLAILLALIFLLALSHGTTLGVAVAGIAAGLVALTRPEFELAVAAAGAVWLIGCARARMIDRRDIVALVGPAVAIPAVVYGVFLTTVSPHRLFFENLYPVDTLRAGGSAIVKSQAPLTLRSIALVIGYFLLYAFGCAALYGASSLLRRVDPTIAAVAVVLVVAALLSVAVADAEAVRSKLQWVFGGIPVAAAVGASILALRYLVRRRSFDRSAQVLLTTLTLLAVLAAKTYSGFYFFADHAQPAMYAAPFALVVLARLHTVELVPQRAASANVAWLVVLAAVCIGLTVKDARAQSSVVSGPGGSLRATPAEASVYRAALGAIESGSRLGEPILVGPQLTALYTLSGRSDPLRELSLVPGALAVPGEEERAIRTLQRDHVRLVITDRHQFREYGQSRFGVSFDRVLYGWVKANFNHAAKLRPSGGVDHVLDVWVRRKS